MRSVNRISQQNRNGPNHALGWSAIKHQSRKHLEGYVASPQNFTLAATLAGFRTSLPLALTTIAFGMVFGDTARHSGLTIIEASFMSLTVYAGTAQFVAISLWSPSISVMNIILTSSVLNFRYILMGATLHPLLSTVPRLKTYGSLFFMSDESWALTTQALTTGKYDGAFLLGSSLGQFISWNLATLAGYSLGSLVRNPDRFGLEFTATIVFGALLVPKWRGKDTLLPWLSAALVAVVCFWCLPGKWCVLTGGIAGGLIGAIRNDQ